MTTEPPAQVPSSDQIGTAAGLNNLHSGADGRGECVWCFKTWPCPDRRWSERILRLAREVRRDA
jgi:hypothetical protein